MVTYKNNLTKLFDESKVLEEKIKNQLEDIKCGD